MPRDALEFILAGADAIQVGTANFVDPFVWQKILDGLADYMTRRIKSRASANWSAPCTAPRFTNLMNRILAALDVPTTRDAREHGRSDSRACRRFKIGSQLFTAEGPALVRELVERGDRVFLDLKYPRHPEHRGRSRPQRGAARGLDGERSRQRWDEDDAGGAGRRRSGGRHAGQPATRDRGHGPHQLR